MYRLDTKTGRANLAVRNGPYYVRLSSGRYLGLRKHSEDHAYWTARFRDDSGKQHHTSLGEFNETFGYDEAVSVALEWFKKLAAGVTGRGDTGKASTVETACREYVDDRKRQSGATAAAAAHRVLVRRVYGERKKGKATEWAYEPDPIALIKLEKLRSKHLEEWRDRLLDANLGRSTVNREMTVVRAALNMAVKNRLVSADQVREWKSVARYKTKGNPRDVCLDLAQRRLMLQAARETFTYTVIRNSKVRKYSPSVRESRGAIANLIEASMHTGARPGELIGALRKDFDSRTHSLTLTGKTGARTFPLSPAGAAFFESISKSKLPKAPLLTRDDGKAWNRSDWDEIVRAIVARAGLPSGTVLYTLRHSWITEAVLSGMSLLEVAKITGTSLAMIDQHYGHLAQNTARERLANITMT